MDRETARNSKLPDRIGPYQIIRRLGAGGMAETFEARLCRPGGFEKRVCVKRILYPHSTDAVFREEFFQEARVLAQLDHPGIVDAYDYGDDDGHLYLVMKLIEGVNFAQLLDHYQHFQRRIPPGVVAYVGAKVAEALHHLHHFVDRDGVARDIVHRDVSPSNILISRTGHVVLVDLGIATFVGRPKLTQTNTVKGKLDYMSPEHIEKYRGLEARSDLFSLGVVLYEALSLTRPFDEPTQIGVHHAVLEGRFDPLLLRAPYLDPELAELVETTLSVDKDLRPSTGRELATRLRALAPHPSPKLALAAAVSECLDGTAPRSLAPKSASHYTGDPLAKAKELAAQWKPKPDLAVADTEFSATLPRAPSSQPPRASLPTPSVPLPAPLRPADAVPSAAVPLPRPRRSPMASGRFIWTVATAVAVIGIAGTWAAFRGPPERRDQGTPQANAEIKPPAEPPAGAAPPAEATPAPAPPELPAAAEATTGSPPAAAPATTEDRSEPAAEPRRKRSSSTGALKVRVINWGYIWLDGEFKGKSPMTFENLKEGVHEIGVAQSTEAPIRSEKIRVLAGQFIEKEFQLNDPLFK